jgi:predicted Abi (CAAX) family protease
MSAIATLTSRLLKAIATLPRLEAWLFSALLLLILTLISLPIGFYTGFLKVESAKSWKTAISVMTICILTPAITEEVCFRVLFLPHPSEHAATASLWLWSGISLCLFIVYHPLNAITFYPAGIRIFFQPTFLLLAAFLGIVCSISYWQSGSVWTPAAIHWITVVVWLLFLGGYKQLNSE